MKNFINLMIFILFFSFCQKKSSQSIIGKWIAQISKEEKDETEYKEDKTMIDRTCINGTLVLEHTGNYKIIDDEKYLISTA